MSMHKHPQSQGGDVCPVAKCIIKMEAQCSYNTLMLCRFFSLFNLSLLNMTCPALANSVDPDQLASEEVN